YRRAALCLRVLFALGVRVAARHRNRLRRSQTARSLGVAAWRTAVRRLDIAGGTELPCRQRDRYGASPDLRARRHADGDRCAQCAGVDGEAVVSDKPPATIEIKDAFRDELRTA